MFDSNWGLILWFKQIAGRGEGHIDFEGFRKIYDEIMTVKEVSCIEREILGLTDRASSFKHEWAEKHWNEDMYKKTIWPEALTSTTTTKTTIKFYLNLYSK